MQKISDSRMFGYKCDYRITPHPHTAREQTAQKSRQTVTAEFVEDCCESVFQAWQEHRTHELTAAADACTRPEQDQASQQSTMDGRVCEAQVLAELLMAAVEGVCQFSSGCGPGKLLAALQWTAPHTCTVGSTKGVLSYRISHWERTLWRWSQS